MWVSTAKKKIRTSCKKESEKDICFGLSPLSSLFFGLLALSAATPWVDGSISSWFLPLLSLSLICSLVAEPLVHLRLPNLIRPLAGKHRRNPMNKNKIGGKFDQVAGKVKQGVEAIGDSNLANKGSRAAGERSCQGSLGRCADTAPPISLPNSATAMLRHSPRLPATTSASPSTPDCAKRQGKDPAWTRQSEEPSRQLIFFIRSPSPRPADSLGGPIFRYRLHSTSAATNTKNTTEITPFKVKNAAFIRRISFGEMIRCSYNNSSATTPIPANAPSPAERDAPAKPAAPTCRDAPSERSKTPYPVQMPVARCATRRAICRS